MHHPIHIHDNPCSIESFLTALGLDTKILHEAVKRGQAARNSATPHDPPNAGGLFAYVHTVRTLRDQLIPQGWASCSTDNFALTVNPHTSIAIAVAGGDEDTGRSEGFPRTRNAKGRRTALAIASNQGDLFNDAEPVNITHDEGADFVGQTWLLLYYADHREVRAELSLPTAMDDRGRVSGWRIRNILPAIPLDPTPALINPDYGPDLDIVVKRRIA
jgi:hypothetical protein